MNDGSCVGRHGGSSSLIDTLIQGAQQAEAEKKDDSVITVKNPGKTYNVYSAENFIRAEKLIGKAGYFTDWFPGATKLEFAYNGELTGIQKVKGNNESFVAANQYRYRYFSIDSENVENGILDSTQHFTTATEKKYKVFSHENFKEAAKYLGEEVYFLNDKPSEDSIWNVSHKVRLFGIRECEYHFQTSSPVRDCYPFIAVEVKD
jgi:hypothetical protein